MTTRLLFSLWVAVVVLALLAGVALAAPQIAEWAPAPGASGYELEVSTGGAFTVVPNVASVCTAMLCTATIMPPAGIARYRVVVLYPGGLRVPRLDAGFYSCLGVAECPLPAGSAGIR